MANRDLTKKENEIYHLFLQGFNSSQICRKLYIQQSTVKTHKNNIFQKKFVHSLPELIAQRLKELGNERLDTAQAIFCLATAVEHLKKQNDAYKKILKGI